MTDQMTKDEFARRVASLATEAKAGGLDAGTMVEVLEDEARGIENDADPQ